MGQERFARGLDRTGALTVVAGTKRPAGWTGKLWALAQGVAFASQTHAPEFVWLTDADIVHAPDTLKSLVRRADANGLALVSLMAKLRCESFAERFLIPAFVYFFQMLYPFARVNDGHSNVAAGAGGCMLVRRTALEAAGGIQAIRGEIIDDCALARSLKARGPIWLGLTKRSVSIREYSFADIARMVARSAYAELRYSPLLLALVLAALLLIFVAPPLWAVFGDGASRYAAFAGWAADGDQLPADAAVLQSLARMGLGAAADRVTVRRVHVRVRRSALAREGRHVERPRTGDGAAMNSALTSAALQSGKGHRDENFPVASWLIHPRHRPAILAFYRFVRAADDIADHPTALAPEKLRLLELFRASLAGESDAAPEGVALRTVLNARNLTAQHALDLLEAFRRDVTVLRYQDWDGLIDYCRYSAMPVGRFVLDVHGESQATWPANDALCAALQIVNHLQDCAKDYRSLDRRLHSPRCVRQGRHRTRGARRPNRLALRLRV
jgi:hypothetical protein